MKFCFKGLAKGVELCYTNICIKQLPVAQLDSASDSDSEGQRFESVRVGQYKRVAAATLLYWSARIGTEKCNTTPQACVWVLNPFETPYPKYPITVIATKNTLDTMAQIITGR